MNLPPDLIRQFSDLERRVARLETVRRVRSLTVDDGSITVVDGAGNPRVILGELSDGSYGLELLNAGGQSVLAETLGFGPSGGFVSALQGTTSTSYTDLGTVGPSANLTIGDTGRMIVIVGSRAIPGETATAHMSYAITGATTRAATDEKGPQVTFVPDQGVFARVETGLNPGAHTVTAKYRRSGPSDTVQFERRTLVAWPF